MKGGIELTDKVFSLRRDVEFVVFDIETTGLSVHNGDCIIELAALRIKDGKPAEEFHSFVDPHRALSWDAFQVNGISPAMIRGAPSREDVLPTLMDFFKDAYVVGHNIKFDLKFLFHELSLIGLKPREDFEAICTVKMARMLLPELGRYPLWFVAESLGIESRQEHRALADVYLTFEVLTRLMKIAQRRDICDLKTFLFLFGQEMMKKRPKQSAQESIDILPLIEEAIRTAKSLHLAYFSRSQGAMTFRKVDPLEIIKTKNDV